MDCRRAKKDIHRLLDGELMDSPLERHVAACASCQKEAQSVRAFQGLLRQARVEIQPDIGFDTIFWEKVSKRQKEPWFAGFFRELEFSIPFPTLSQAMAFVFVAFFIGGTGGAVSAMNAAAPSESKKTSVQYLSGFHEFKGVPSSSVTATYLKTIENRSSA